MIILEKETLFENLADCELVDEDGNMCLLGKILFAASFDKDSLVGVSTVSTAISRSDLSLPEELNWLISGDVDSDVSYKIASASDNIALLLFLQSTGYDDDEPQTKQRLIEYKDLAIGLLIENGIQLI